MAIGRRLFEQDPRTNWTLAPEFLTYAGHILPVGDGAVTRVLLCDEYHHLPNPGRLFREMRRVLTPDRIVAISEPGRGHGLCGASMVDSHAAPA
jgi:SAM-dependent methyltransferase